MTSPATSPASAPPARRWSVGRIAIVVTVALLLAMWAYVLYLAFVPGRQPPPDRLDHPAFALHAQSICQAAHDDVAQLPRAIDTESAAQRATIVADANGRFSEMVDDLAAITPPGEDGTIVTAWLADWRTYLGDREAYADDLRTDPEARLLVTAKGREQITEYIDSLARDNHMPACGTPLDVS